MDTLVLVNIPENFTKRDIDNLFYIYGKIEAIEKNKFNKIYYFWTVKFKNERDASTAIHFRNGEIINTKILNIYSLPNFLKSIKPEDKISRFYLGKPRQIIIRGLPDYFTKREVDNLFYRYGRILSIKTHVGFFTVKFKNYRDADNAIALENELSLELSDENNYYYSIDDSDSEEDDSSDEEDDSSDEEDDDDDDDNNDEGTKIVIRGLPEYSTIKDVNDLFYRYGKILRIKSHDGFFSVRFKDNRSADNAVRGRNGFFFDEFPLEVSKEDN